MASRFSNATPVLAALAFLLAGCVDSDKASTTPELDAAFVGYSNPDTRQTTCGNCHVGKQRDWVQTRHAGAWSSLQGSGHAAGYCEPCHTTGGLGNWAPDSAGYLSVAADARKFYYDVQCESCHGPGAGHVALPDDAQPLSTIVADTAATIGCGTCHRGTHTPFIEEWQASGHGTLQAYPAGRAECAGCHEAKAALARYEPRTRYLEVGGATNYPITCAVCHDPHGSPHGAQLRLAITTASLESNLCMTCHSRNFLPNPASYRGAHAPQGPLLLGEGGWVPPDFAYDATRAATTHGSTANPRLCAGCHMESFSVTDAATGAFIVNSVGHSFKAIPCVDENGRPTGETECPDGERRYEACTGSGCHAGAAQVIAVRQILEGRLRTNYLDVLWKDKNGNGYLDPLPTDSGLLAQVRASEPGEFATTGDGATNLTVGKGVWFNAQMVMLGDGSMGVHNPFYAEALLISSLQALRARYTYLPAPRPAEQQQLEARMRALGVVRR